MGRSLLAAGVCLGLAVVLIVWVRWTMTGGSSGAVDPRAKFKTSTTQLSPTTQALLPRNAPADVGQVELSFYKYTADGRLWPVRFAEPNGVELVRVDGNWAAGFAFEASALRLAVGAAQSSRQLEAHGVYTTRGLPINRRFEVPDVNAGAVVRFQLIIDDDRKNGL